MTRRNTLGFRAYAPALVGRDVRVLDVIHGMERALPGLRLAWRIPNRGRPIALPHRDAWLAEATQDGGFPLLCNGDNSYPVTVSGRETSARFSPGGQALFEVNAVLPLDEPVIAAATAMLESVAEGARSFWGRVTPYETAVDIAYQTAPTREGPPAPLRGLPALKLPKHLRSPELPCYLGWVNYWSAATAQVIGFPDLVRDAELLTRSRRTPSGGWLVQLTTEPLELDIPSHLEALKEAYERFPAIGGRDAPR
jgi:hypothetical protein